MQNSYLVPSVQYLTSTLRFKRQFSKYLADGVGSEDIEEIYTNAYAAIREDPVFKPTEKTKNWSSESKKYLTPKLSYEQRKANVDAKIRQFKAGAEAAAGSDDE